MSIYMSRAELEEISEGLITAYANKFSNRVIQSIDIEHFIKIYSVYLKYIAPEDIFPYSIDEVFIDATNYLNIYQMTARELAMTMIQDVLKTTGITATAGIGTNMYLCKIAMDIVAKHIEPDKDGVRIAELDEMSYRRQLWNHRPLTDFWRVGKGYAKKLEEHGLFTMGDIARCSIGKSNELYNEELLYKLFGINAELLIDHAWGYEPCTMEQPTDIFDVCTGVWGIGIPIKRLARRYAVAIKWRYGNTWMDFALIYKPSYIYKRWRGKIQGVREKNFRKIKITQKLNF